MAREGRSASPGANNNSFQQPVFTRRHAFELEALHDVPLKAINEGKIGCEYDVVRKFMEHIHATLGGGGPGGSLVDKGVVHNGIFRAISQTKCGITVGRASP